MYKKLKSPLTVHLELTSACNHGCIHCYNHWRARSDIVNTYLNRDLAEHIINELAQNEVMHVILTGGEPLLNFDILTFVICSLRSRNISFSLNTNATLLTLEKAEILKAIGLESVLISLLSADRHIHDYLTDRQNQFDKVVRGIKNAHDAGLFVSINMVVSKVNLDQVFATGLFIKNLGICSFAATRATLPANYQDRDKELLVKEGDARIIVEQLMALHDIGIEVKSLIPYPVCFLQSPEEYKLFSSKFCSAGKMSMAISASGTVFACPHIEKSYGSLKNYFLSHIWEEMSEWRDGSLIPPSCRNCRALHICGGGCRAATGISRHTYDHDQIIIKPVSDSWQPCFSDPKYIADDIFLRINPNCRFRREENFGIVNTGGIRNLLVSSETFNLFLDLHKQHRVFTAEQLFNEASINMEKSAYARFMGYLSDNKAIQPCRKGGD